MVGLALLAFIAMIAACGLKRPFMWVLLYIYIDIVIPQKVGWGLIQMLPLSLMVFVLAFGGWLVLDSKQGSKFTFRQGLIILLLAWCAMTTLTAAFPVEAMAKWDWVWKSLVFAAFLPLALRTWLRLEAAVLIMVLSAASIIIPVGIKTLLSGGGYGTLASLVTDNSGLYEGSTLSTVAIAIIPLTLWAARHGTIFPKSTLTQAFGIAVCFAALLVPIGTETRTGLICIAVLAVLSLRSVRNRGLYMAGAALALVVAVPFLPASFTERMGTITGYQGDESASTRVAVWSWTIDYVRENPLGGGFDSFLGNSFTYQTRRVTGEGANTSIEYATVTDEGRAFHSAYFELLGEQGFIGFGLWALFHLLGLWQMEKIRRRFARSTDPRERAWHSLANALQQGQLIYLVGALFIGVGYQPFIFMLLATQIALATLVGRTAAAKTEVARPWLKNRADVQVPDKQVTA